LIGIVCAAPFVIDLRARWREAGRDAAIAGLVALMLAAPWYVAMTLRHGTEFLRVAIWTQNVGRYSGQMADHGQSAAVFALAVAVGLLPWVGLLPAAITCVRRPGTNRREAVRFVLVVMAAASLVFYSASASKLASYSLALIPPLAAVIGIYLDDVLTHVRRGRAAFLWAGAVLAIVAAALAATPLMNGTAFRMRDLTGGVPAATSSETIWWIVTPLLIVFVAGALALFVLSARGRIAGLAVTGIAAPLVALLVMAPILSDAYPWQRFGTQISRAPGRVWIQMYRAPSLTFFSGQPVTIVTDGELPELLTKAESGWVVLGADWSSKPELAARLAAAKAEVVDRSPRLILVKLR
jgi:hypothetical protein